MKIAMMVRGYMTAPRPSDIIYAPIDLAVSIAEGLAARGHEVHFYGPTGSHIQGVTVHTLGVRPLVHNQQEFGELVHDTDRFMHYVPQLWDAKFADDMFGKAIRGEYDILHFHHPEVALPMAFNHPKVPVVYTQHDPFKDWYRDIYNLYASKNQHFVSISNNQRRDAPDLAYAATAYNGVDTNLWQFNADAEDYLIIAGRIVPEKGIREAIKVAQNTNHRLLIIGPVYPDHQEYFDHSIKPHLNDKILYLGFMEQQQLVKYYQKAKAFLMPIQWEEPFGLTMTESMACGTPVIALNRGSVSEVVKDGKTGFIVSSLAEMEEAVGKVDKIKREDCRRHVEQNFSINNMVDAYEKLFCEILNVTPSSRFRAGQRSGQQKRQAIRQKLGKVKSKLPHRPRPPQTSLF